MITNTKKMVVIFCCILVIAGCGGSGTGPTTATENLTTDDRVDDTATTTRQGTTTALTTVRTDTRTTDDQQGLDQDLRVYNSDDEERTVRVIVEAESDGTVVFNRTVTVAPNESSEFDISFPEDGAYVASVRTERANETVTFPADPEGYLDVHFQDTETTIVFVEP